MKKLILGVAIALLCGCEEEAGDWVRHYDYQFAVRNMTGKTQYVSIESGDINSSIALSTSGNWCIGSDDSIFYIRVGDGYGEVNHWKYNCNKKEELVLR